MNERSKVLYQYTKNGKEHVTPSQLFVLLYASKYKDEDTDLFIVEGDCKTRFVIEN